MATIREFDVLEPPSSGEVQERALEALQSSGYLRVVLIGHEAVEPPDIKEVTFRIAQTIHPPEGGMRIAGSTTENESVVVRMSDNLATAATASMVVPSY